MRFDSAPHWILGVTAALAVGTAAAQASKDAPSGTAAPAPAAEKSAPAAKKPAERRLDFVPSGAVKGTAAQQTPAPATGTWKPGMYKEGGGHCQGKASDA